LGGFTRAQLETIEKGQRALEAKRVAAGVGTRGEHARAAIRRRGIRVRCSGEKDDVRGCGYQGRARTSRLRRLRRHACPTCQGRLRPASWPGFDAVDVEIDARLDDALAEYSWRALVAQEDR
jgi:hypothetical protein